eukprot:gene12053-biopygen22939
MDRNNFPVIRGITRHAVYSTCGTAPCLKNRFVQFQPCEKSHANALGEPMGIQEPRERVSEDKRNLGSDCPETSRTLVIRVPRPRRVTAESRIQVQVRQVASWGAKRLRRPKPACPRRQQTLFLCTTAPHPDPPACREKRQGRIQDAPRTRLMRLNLKTQTRPGFAPDASSA